jgi:hypothetical protein
VGVVGCVYFLGGGCDGPGLVSVRCVFLRQCRSSLLPSLLDPVGCERATRLALSSAI